jgi:5-formyltetrahydrofolate cyclo-ligase
MTSGIREAKQAVRERVWALMEREGVVVPPGSAHGRIPNFIGARAAADRLADLGPWRSARVVIANPAWAQHPVRIRALADGKLLYMAVPRLATLKPFYLLDPTKITPPYEVVADPQGAAGRVPTVGVDEMRPIDLVVCGTVSVNHIGTRVGKGAGYTDVEVALLAEAELIGSETTIVTTVHKLQVLDNDLPEAEHDFGVDLVVTPDDVMRCGPRRPSSRIVRANLTVRMVDEVPALWRFTQDGAT